MSASAPVFKEQSSFNCLGSSHEAPPPSYSSLYPDYPDQGHAVGSINSNQYGYPPYTPYPQQQYVISHEGTPLIGTTPLTVYPKQPAERNNVTTLIYLGGCPLCRVGVMEEEYPFVAVCCAVLFFPLGLLCCLPMRQKRCNNCNYVIE